MFLKKTLAAAILSVGVISAANAAMIRDDYNITIGFSNMTEFTNGQIVNLGVTYDDSQFISVSYNSSGSEYRKFFLNPVVDWGGFAVLFPQYPISGYILNYTYQYTPSFSPSGEFFTLNYHPIRGQADSFYLGFDLNGTYYTNFTYAQNSRFRLFNNIGNISRSSTVIQNTQNAVPEPESLAMMLLGFPMMAWTVRRRKSVIV